MYMRKHNHVILTYFMGIHYNEDRRQKHSMRRSVCVCVLAGLSLPTLLAASPATEQSRVAKVEASTNLNDQSSKKVKIIGVVTDSKTGEPSSGLRSASRALQREL